MTPHKQEMVELLHHGIDPFAFYVPMRNNVDMQGWRSNHPYLQKVIEQKLPKTVVEVGVWKGGSAMTMATKLKSLHIDSVVIAVDTFRGSPEHWCNPKFWELLKVNNGIPALYDIFMANIISKNLQDYILPLPVDSMTAYEICRRKGFLVDLLHIDAGHEYDAVSSDLQTWSRLLAPNGTIIMDDYMWDDAKQAATGWPGVAKAVNEFVKEKGDKVIFEHSGGKCMLTF